MAGDDVGNVLVVENGEVKGIVTLETLSPDDSVEDAIRKMEQRDVRRLPVVEDGKPVGIVALGDLAQERDRDSALADISSAAPNN
jgi:CBS domain-containing protein